jgi:hypothetical protein
MLLAVLEIGDRSSSVRPFLPNRFLPCDVWRMLSPVVTQSS